MKFLFLFFLGVRKEGASWRSAWSTDVRINGASVDCDFARVCFFIEPRFESTLSGVVRFIRLGSVLGV